MCNTCIGSIIGRLGKNTSIQGPRCKTERVSLFVRNHHITLALFREFLQNKLLLMPANTRFACNFMMIIQTIEVREAPENVIMHRKFTEYVAILFNCQNGIQAHELGTRVKSHISNENFWRH